MSVPAIIGMLLIQKEPRRDHQQSYSLIIEELHTNNDTNDNDEFYYDIYNNYPSTPYTPSPPPPSPPPSLPPSPLSTPHQNTDWNMEDFDQYGSYYECILID